VANNAPNRSTQEIIESLKRIESNEITRLDGPETKLLTSQLAKYAERIDIHLNNAKMRSTSYKNLIDEDLFAASEPCVHEQIDSPADENMSLGAHDQIDSSLQRTVSINPPGSTKISDSFTVGGETDKNDATASIKSNQDCDLMKESEGAHTVSNELIVDNNDKEDENEYREDFEDE